LEGVFSFYKLLVTISVHIDTISVYYSVIGRFLCTSCGWSTSLGSVTAMKLWSSTNGDQSTKSVRSLVPLVSFAAKGLIPALFCMLFECFDTVGYVPVRTPVCNEATTNTIALWRLSAELTHTNLENSH